MTPAPFLVAWGDGVGGSLAGPLVGWTLALAAPAGGAASSAARARQRRPFPATVAGPEG
jgi:hypothetical protein